jgi:hypothetical protein
MRIILIWVLFPLAHARLYAQDLPAKTHDQLEQLAENTDRELLQDDDLPQRLAYYQKHPININSATVDELSDLGLLNELQINNLIIYRKLNGKLIDIYELQSIPMWDVALIESILPYIKLGRSQTAGEQLLSRLKGQHNLTMTWSGGLERSAGYDTSTKNHYLGDPAYLRMKYRYQFKDLLQFGFSGEKDPGEQFFKGAQKAGFDFYSFYVFVRKVGVIKALALGDYTVNMGQGLIQWQTLAFGKGSDVMSVKRQAPVLLPYRSGGEYNFNRGFGITIQKGAIEATLFSSLKKISGNRYNDTTDWFSSMLTSGLHRTPLEIADRNTITQLSSGSNLSYHGRLFSLGLNTVYHFFSVPFQKRAAPYNIYAFSGNKLFQSSLDYSFALRNMHFFGEAAIDMHLHHAVLGGVLIPLDPKIDLSLLYRNIAKGYQSISADAFTESSQPVNEKGIYVGIGIKPDALWQFNAYADIYCTPWIHYRVSGPSNGYDYMLQAVFRPDKSSEFSLRYRNFSKPVDLTGDQTIPYVTAVVKRNLRISMIEKISNALSLKGRCEIMWLAQEQMQPEQGFLAYLELNYRLLKWIKVDFRFQQFETDGYQSRVYAFGSDALSGYHTPAFYDKGFHNYLILDCRPFRQLNIKLLYAKTGYPNRSTVGTGLDMINGNAKSQIGIQLQYLFKERK